jgi:hypothetical protein
MFAETEHLGARLLRNYFQLSYGRGTVHIRADKQWLMP